MMCLVLLAAPPRSILVVDHLLNISVLLTTLGGDFFSDLLIDIPQYVVPFIAKRLIYS